MRTPLSIAGMLLALAFAAPPSTATVDDCTTPATLFTTPKMGGVLVPTTKAYHDGSCAGTGVVGGPWPGIDPCTAPGVYAVATGGAYCGVVKPAFAFAVCNWFPLGPTTATTLTVGFDVDLDGNIFPVDGPAYEVPLLPLNAGWVLANPHPVPARIIAYPTQLTGPLPNADAALVNCA